MNVPRIHLINPNSSETSTEIMLAVARHSAKEYCEVVATTSPDAPALITNSDQLQLAETRLLAMFRSGLDPMNGVIVAAFGDPGLEALQRSLNVPVLGLAQSSMREASRYGCFSIVSTTAQLTDTMYACARANDVEDRLISVRISPVDPVSLLSKPDDLEAMLGGLIDEVVAKDGADAVIVGGGPLAAAAANLASQFDVPIIQPVVAAVSQMTRALKSLQP